MENAKHFDILTQVFSNFKFTSDKVNFEIKVNELVRTRVTKGIEVLEKDYECIKAAFKASLDFKTSMLYIL